VAELHTKKAVREEKALLLMLLITLFLWLPFSVFVFLALCVYLSNKELLVFMYTIVEGWMVCAHCSAKRNGRFSSASARSAQSVALHTSEFLASTW
jgi:hypothetical protein